MSIKKSFSISKDLASGIRSSIQSATTNQGQFHYDMMSLDVIECDPENPRKLVITKDEILNGISKVDINYAKKFHELEALTDLAESIKKVGIRNAIEVYKEGSGYRIISGERRYLAAHLAGIKSIPARINQKLDEFKLRYIQWVENINRQDLSLSERYNNLLSMSVAYQKTQSTTLNADRVKELLGVSSAQSYRYLCLLNAEPKIIELVKSGRINNLKHVQELTSIKSHSEREQFLNDLDNPKTSSASKLKAYKDKKISAKNVISLGKTQNATTVKYLIKTIILNDTKLTKYKAKFNNIDWTSIKAVNKAFKDFLKVIDHEISSIESVNEI